VISCDDMLEKMTIRILVVAMVQWEDAARTESRIGTLHKGPLRQLSWRSIQYAGIRGCRVARIRHANARQTAQSRCRLRVLRPVQTGTITLTADAGSSILWHLNQWSRHGRGRILVSNRPACNQRDQAIRRAQSESAAKKEWQAVGMKRKIRLSCKEMRSEVGATVRPGLSAATRVFPARTDCHQAVT